MDTQKIKQFLYLWTELCKPNEDDMDFRILCISQNPNGLYSAFCRMPQINSKELQEFDQVAWLRLDKFKKLILAIECNSYLSKDFVLHGISMYSISGRCATSALCLLTHLQTKNYYTVWLYLLARQTVINSKNLPEDFPFKTNVDKAVTFFSEIVNYLESQNFNLPQYNKRGEDILPKTDCLHKANILRWNLRTEKDYLLFLYSEMLYLKENYRIVCEKNLVFDKAIKHIQSSFPVL